MNSKLVTTVFLLAGSFLLAKASLNNVVLTTKESTWKRFDVTWNTVNLATVYNTTLKCGNYTVNNVTTSTTMLYDTVSSNTSCTFEIFAENDSSGDKSLTEIYTFQSAGSPEPPKNLVIEKHPDEPTTQLYIKWEHPVSLDQERLKSVRYQISYMDSATFLLARKTVLTDNSALNYTLTGLEENTIYWIEVAAYDETTGEVGAIAKGNKLTEKTGVSNLVIALVTIGITIIIIIALAVATFTHFKKKYGKL